MRTRYFVRVLGSFANYRDGHEVALEENEFDAVRGKGLVSVMHKECDGKVVKVDDDEGAAKTAIAKPKDETFPLDTLTDEEKDIILSRRAAAEKKKADDDAKAKAAAEKAAKAEADRVAAAEKKKADDDAKAKAKG